MTSRRRTSCGLTGRMHRNVGLVREGSVDTVCPNFYVLAHATGCMFQPHCEYCYLHDRKQFTTGTAACSDLEQMKAEISAWIARDNLPSYVLNSGNISDSLCFEDVRPAMAELIELFRREAQLKGRPHTLLLVTKGGLHEIKCLLGVLPSPNVIVSFSVNSADAAARLEAGAASPEDRLAAAKLLKELGWRVRIRIDPMILGSDYRDLCVQIRDLSPERVTLGTLRAEKSLVDALPKDVLAGLADPGRPDGLWQYPTEPRLALYRQAVDLLKDTCSIGLCEEWPSTWDALGLARENFPCNCNHV